ncbi:hypothetical protein PIB30_016780 [Stylosanthes scabra]|uniref:TIR domain-containing protein n=1 Tax=Stylosanthes scabra TaxID=79078 RepID=A0ABU6R7P0_9FABA|nr:hypothetical protein [Stylosanthes scabra]
MDLQSPFSSIHSFSYNYPWKYDVFISFRGEDTRYGFTGNLYKALCDKGIHTFFDDNELQSGEEITPALLKAIQESRIAIIVLSPDYAASSFCLDELVKVLDCIKDTNRLVLPVFYEVDPSDVRHQRNSYGEAMAKHEKRFKDDLNKVQKWKEALHQVANLSGYHFKYGDGYEHMFIGNIVEKISRKIKRVPLPVADYPVGLESRVSKVIPLMEMDSTDRVHMLGIHGIGGIGKTTLALAIYNLIADHFDGVCFLANVRDNSNKYGLTHLQNILLSEILGNEEVKVASVQQGTSIIQRRLSRKKVLLILDDVDDHKQLQAIAGKLHWFGGGSRVIITTRDTQLLKCHGVENMHEVQGLNKKESYQLLIKKAFKNGDASPSYYADVLNRVITYASGHPLALEIVGSNLFGKEVEDWESALQQYERIPNGKIQKILKISYDALEENEQNIFLDITCCFKRYNLTQIRDIFLAHYGDDMIYHIQQLVDKSLIKINEPCQLLTFHDLIEDMGKEIVRQESPKVVGQRSRLWFHEDIVQVLEENQGTSAVEIIYLEFPLSKMEEKEKNKDVQVVWDGTAFKKMKNLKTLIVKNGCFSKGPVHLPNSLRVMEWWEYPSKYFPSDFHPKKLSILKLPNSLFTSCKLDNLSKKLVALKVLNFDNSNFLEEIGDVSNLPTLEELSFRGCKNLTRIHSSIGFLGKLKTLDAERCQKLRSFPSMNLPSLKILTLSHCSSLEKFPEIVGKMENVEMLLLDGTNIRDLPLSFRNLSKLCNLIMLGSRIERIPSVIFMMPKLSMFFIDGIGGNRLESQKQEEGIVTSLSSSSLPFLDIYLLRLSLSDDFLPQQLPRFPNLKTLCLAHCDITFIPECIQELQFLSRLQVDSCTFLQEIRGIPPNLEDFSALYCESLTPSSAIMLLNQELHDKGNTHFVMPRACACIPSWFEHCSKITNSISFWFRGKFPAKSLCLAILLDYSCHGVKPIVTINGKKVSFGSRGTTVERLFIFDLWKTNHDDDLDKLLFQSQEWNHAEVSCEVTAAEMGIHILKQKSSSIMEDIRFTHPYKKRKRDGHDSLNSIIARLPSASQNMMECQNPLDCNEATSHTVYL